MAYRSLLATFTCVALLLGCTCTTAPLLVRQKNWSIGILEGSSPLDLETAGMIAPRLTWRDIPGISARFVADPFLVRRGAKWLLFFELFNEGSQRGEIALAESDDLVSWSFRDVVLAEPFHLSYPFVFEHHGQHYMIPESRAKHEVRLYRAHNFPFDWRLEKVLIQGNYADSSIVQFGDTWWLFTSLPPYTAALFHAPSPLGPWTQHPSSPMYADDSSRARPGGAPLVLDGKLVRFVQDNRQGYGKKVRAMEVTALSATSFFEHPLEPDPLLGPGGEHWRWNGMHHISAVKLPNGRWVAAVDGNGDGLPDHENE